MTHKHRTCRRWRCFLGEAHPVWQQRQEVVPETLQQILERLPAAERPDAARRIQEHIRAQTQEAIAQHQPRGGERPRQGDGAEVQPYPFDLRDPEKVRKQIDKTVEEFRKQLQAAQGQLGREGVDPGKDMSSVPKEAGHAGLAAAKYAFIPSYLAYLASLGEGMHALTGGIGGVLGYGVGKWWKGDQYPRAAPVLGAIGGVVAPPLLHTGLATVGSVLSKATPAIASGITGLATGVTAGLISYAVARKRGVRPMKAAGIGAGIGAVSAVPATLIGSTWPAGVTNIGTVLSGFSQWLTQFVPSLSAIPAALPPAASLGLTVGAGAAGLSGVGRLHGYLWESKKAGLFKNMVRGAFTPITIPAWALHLLGIRMPKALYHKTTAFLGRQVEATKRMFTGKSSVVKWASSPFWFPVRSAWNVGQGVWRGLHNEFMGTGPSETDKKKWFFGRAGRAVGITLAKPLTTPWRFGKWLLSPTWQRGGGSQH